MNFDIQCSAETLGHPKKVTVTVYPRLFDILSTVWPPQESHDGRLPQLV